MRGECEECGELELLCHNCARCPDCCDCDEESGLFTRDELGDDPEDDAG